jgi:hypothetical protein
MASLLVATDGRAGYFSSHANLRCALFCETSQVRLENAHCFLVCLAGKLLKNQRQVMGERIVRNDEVVGSSPTSSTIFNRFRLPP